MATIWSKTYPLVKLKDIKNIGILNRIQRKFGKLEENTLIEIIGFFKGESPITNSGIITIKENGDTIQESSKNTK
jgi:hypothetical protein